MRYEQIDFHVAGPAGNGCYYVSEMRLKSIDQTESGEEGDTTEHETIEAAEAFAESEAREAVESGRCDAATVFVDGNEVLCVWEVTHAV